MATNTDVFYCSKCLPTIGLPYVLSSVGVNYGVSCHFTDPSTSCLTSPFSVTLSLGVSPVKWYVCRNITCLLYFLCQTPFLILFCSETYVSPCLLQLPEITTYSLARAPPYIQKKIFLSEDSKQDKSLKGKVFDPGRKSPHITKIIHLKSLKTNINKHHSLLGYNISPLTALINSSFQTERA